MKIFLKNDSWDVTPFLLSFKTVNLRNQNLGLGVPSSSSDAVCGDGTWVRG